jgi:hypothetical protein
MLGERKVTYIADIKRRSKGVKMSEMFVNLRFSLFFGTHFVIPVLALKWSILEEALVFYSRRWLQPPPPPPILQLSLPVQVYTTVNLQYI